MSTTEFLKKIKSGAILGWERHRILPSITGAQGILEGASGTSKLAQAPYYNQFGIKASPDWTGKKVKMMTWEEIGGRKVNVEAEFRWYDSIEESVADHAAFFTNTEWRKNNYRHVVGEKDYKVAARALQNAGYATDSQYANKLIRLIETHGLRAWDEEAFSGSVAPTLAPVSSEGAMITPTTETDVVGRYSIEDLEYKDDLLHSPKGESVIYNPTLNDVYGFQTKSGDVLWIDHVLEVNSEDPQEIMDEAVKYMKENAQPDAQYRVKLKHLPDNISIGDTGMFVDHKFNPPLYIEARILEIVTSISNPENDSVVVGNVREVKSQTDASIRALQKELQDTREKLVDDYFAKKELEVSIQANNGLALIDTGVTHAIELISEQQNEIKLVANTPYKINLNAPQGANVDTYTLTGELLNNTFTAEFEDVVNPIVVEPEPVIDETLISGIVGSDNHGATVESPQGDKVAIVDSVADFTGLRVKELNFKFYDATGALVHEEDVPVNINSKISHSVFKEGVIFASMAITSKSDVTVQGLSFKEPTIFDAGAKTTDLIARFNFDVPHNYIWTRVSDDDDADLLWNDRNKFNNSNNLKITIEDINGDKSTFILTVYDENGNVIAGTSETVKADKSPDKISAEVEQKATEIVNRDGVTVSFSDVEPENAKNHDVWFKLNEDGSQSIMKHNGVEWFETVTNALNADGITSGTIDFSLVNAIHINASSITAGHGEFLSIALTALNSSASLDGAALRFTNDEHGFIEMNSVPEIRSTGTDGTSAILDSGRVHFYDTLGMSKGYLGTDRHDGTRDFGIFLSKGNGTFRFARMADAESTIAKYYTVKPGDYRVSIIENLVLSGELPDGGHQDFINKSNMIATLNGWAHYPVEWPTLRAGQQIKYQEEVITTEGDAYDDIWKFGPSSQGDWRVYFLKHARFEGGFTDVSDRRVKHDILPTAIKALPEIEKFNFKEYKMDSDGRHVDLGLIAQEAGILRVADDELEGIDIQKGIMLALKGIQELQQQAKEMEQEIRELKGVANEEN